MIVMDDGRMASAARTTSCSRGGRYRGCGSSGPDEPAGACRGRGAGGRCGRARGWRPATRSSSTSAATRRWTSTTSTASARLPLRGQAAAPGGARRGASHDAPAPRGPAAVAARPPAPRARLRALGSRTAARGGAGDARRRDAGALVAGLAAAGPRGLCCSACTSAPRCATCTGRVGCTWTSSPATWSSTAAARRSSTSRWPAGPAVRRAAARARRLHGARAGARRGAGHANRRLGRGRRALPRGDGTSPVHGRRAADGPGAGAARALAATAGRRRSPGRSTRRWSRGRRTGRRSAGSPTRSTPRSATAPRVESV